MHSSIMAFYASIVTLPIPTYTLHCDRVFHGLFRVFHGVSRFLSLIACAGCDGFVWHADGFRLDDPACMPNGVLFEFVLPVQFPRLLFAFAFRFPRPRQVWIGTTRGILVTHMGRTGLVPLAVWVSELSGAIANRHATASHGTMRHDPIGESIHG
jgi:hypothetical protein